MSSTITIRTPTTHAPRTAPGPSQDPFFMRFLLHPPPNPRPSKHFRALRAVIAVRAHSPSAFIRGSISSSCPLVALRGPVRMLSLHG